MAVYPSDRRRKQGCHVMVDAVRTKGAAADRSVARILAARAATSAQAQPQPPSADTARLSGVAAELSARPPVDADRVSQIKRAIATGTFPILPATIADRLLAVRYEWMNDEQA
jgi:negative regulator of flagellin synthesis FlgM